MIKINNEFEYKTDKYNWILHQLKDSFNKEGKPIKTVRVSYHANMLQMINTIIDRSLKHCESFDLIPKKIKDIKKELECLS
jgi:hypothetical protein